MNVYLNKELDGRETEGLIEQYKYGRYIEDRSLPLKDSRRFMLDYMRRFISQDDSECISAFSSAGQLLGVLLFRLSRWDTELFEYKVAIIDSIITRELVYDQSLKAANALLEHFLVWCKTSDIRFVSAKVPALNLPVVHSLENFGFRYIESWIYNKYDLNKIDGLSEVPYELRLARPNDCHVMLDYAKGAFATHRFYADPFIPRQKADSLYEKWIITAFRDLQQEILVLDVENKPVAFMIYYKNDLRQYFGLQFAMWKMALLNPASRGKKLGIDFFIAVMRHNRKDGLDVVESGLSMRNLASLNLHIRLNFKVISTLANFHKWLTSNEAP